MGKVALLTVVVGLMTWLVPDLVFAAGAGGGMPWETPLQRLVDSLTGPVAKAIGIVSIFIFGATVALSEGGGLRIVMGIIFGAEHHVCRRELGSDRSSALQAVQ